MISIAEACRWRWQSCWSSCLEMSGRHGRTYNYAVGSREKIDVGEQAQLFFRAESSFDDSLHFDEVKGHHVKVGVGVLPNREGRRCYSGL